MRRVRELLRLHFDCSLSNGQISSALKISKGSVHNTLKRFAASGLTWPVPGGLGDRELESALFPPSSRWPVGEVPDFAWVREELYRPHMTLQLLWEEYEQAHPEGLSRSSFYRGYKEHCGQAPVTMRQRHVAGDKLQVDYSGDKLSFIDRTSGTVTSAELFVCSWGASSYCYAEASPSQKQEDFVTSHVRALQYFGCVPRALVPDNLKSAVMKASSYEPTINTLYAAMAAHYDVAVVPARVRKPRDKAVVESNVLHLQRHLFGRLRDRMFYSLAELNSAIAEELEVFNARPMKDHGGKSRIERFNELDRPAARPLPARAFGITKIKTNVRVGPNYHIEFEQHHYSLPCELAGQSVEVHRVGDMLEIYHDAKHICRHPRSAANYDYTTREEHMPAHHRYVRGWSSEYFLDQAARIGPACRQAVEAIIESKRHPEQGFKAARGVLRLAKTHGAARVENAAARARHFTRVSYRDIKSILIQNLDRQANQAEAITVPEPTTHDNLRGADYYAV